MSRESRTLDTFEKSTADDVRSIYRKGREFFVQQRGLHRFPGAFVEKAFNLAIKGLHYETVTNGIVAHER